MDLNDDLVPERISWFKQGDAILVYDVNGNGTFDNIKEISISWLTEKSGSSDLEGLMTLDSNQDGQISHLDNEYSHLYLWKDNGDGIPAHQELIQLQQVNGSFTLEAELINKVDQGNYIHKKFHYKMGEQQFDAYDVFLTTKYEQQQ